MVRRGISSRKKRVAANAGFAKRNYSYAEWTKDKFSEVVTVSGPAKLIFLAGVGAEDENGGGIRHKDDVAAQLRYAYRKIKRNLAQHGASFSDIVKMVTYVTDVRYFPICNQIRRETFGSAPLPAHTFLTISQLAWPGMLIEIDVTAAIPG